MFAGLRSSPPSRTAFLDDEDLEGLDELKDEMEEQDEESEGNAAQDELPLDPKKLKSELAELRSFAKLARRISVNAKGEALVPALKVAFEKAELLGAQRRPWFLPNLAALSSIFSTCFLPRL